MHFALSLFILGYACSRLLAVALLGSVSGVALVAVLVSECLALLLARVAMKNWRFYMAAGDSAAFSILVAHLVYYLLMQAAPCSA